MKAIQVRYAQPYDIDALLRLMHAHAAFEHAQTPAATGAALHRAMFGDTPVLLAWVADIDDVAVGYMTATRDFSSWHCAPYLHMDCLYVEAEYRGCGIGAALFAALARAAGEQGIAGIQWQTPEWNERAAAFYRRVGAVESRKRRYAFAVAADTQLADRA